jgi:hypothetical protein
MMMTTSSTEEIQVSSLRHNTNQAIFILQDREAH